MDNKTPAENLWIEYHYLTEIFDRNLPHRIHLITGDAIPHPDYMYLSNSYADKKRSIMQKLAKFYKISNEDYEKGKQYSNMMTFYGVKRAYLTLKEFHLGRY